MPASAVTSLLYADADFAAIDKPAALPSDRTRDPRRPNALDLTRALLGLAPADFLGLPHRLDRDTSGVLLFARSAAVLARTNRQFELRQVKKRYVAVVHGRFAEECRVESRLGPVARKNGVERWGSVERGGKAATSIFRPLRVGRDSSLVECELTSGRTHQLRVHLSELGHPILGDELYDAPAAEHARLGRHLLHAARLELPRDSEPLVLEAAVPPLFLAQLNVA